MYVLKFINALKTKLNKKRQNARFVTTSDADGYYNSALMLVIKMDQRKHYADVFEYYGSKNTKIRDIPPLVSRLNAFVDKDGVIKVKSKFDRWSDRKSFAFPILMSDKSLLTDLIVADVHIKASHGGCYNVLNFLRKEFWIPRIFTAVKRILKNCVTCKRFNARPVKINQNAYRFERASPPCEVFKYVYMDYLGPFMVYQGNMKQKVWLLCITCMWSRAVAIKICPDQSVRSFLRAFQMHVMEQGLPCRVFSDLGSQLTVGTSMIADYLLDVETMTYLNENGIKNVKFEQYFKGNSALGSLVEVCVKFIKRLLFGAIKNNVLQYHDFEFMIVQTISLLNKRPIAFKQGLRDTDSEGIPSPISPELLLKGKETITVNIVPPLHPGEDNDVDWSARLSSKDVLRQEFSKLRKARENIFEIYNVEFTQMLIDQATNDGQRYKPVPHHKLRIDDIILLKENNTKTNNFPMAIVTKVFTNSRDEVTDVIAKKGRTREIVKRHVTSVIPLLRPSQNEEENNPTEPGKNTGEPGTSEATNSSLDGDHHLDSVSRGRPKRRAAMVSRKKTSAMFSDGGTRGGLQH